MDTLAIFRYRWEFHLLILDNLRFLKILVLGWKCIIPRPPKWNLSAWIPKSTFLSHLMLYMWLFYLNLSLSLLSFLSLPLSSLYTHTYLFLYMYVHIIYKYICVYCIPCGCWNWAWILWKLVLSIIEPPLKLPCLHI